MTACLNFKSAHLLNKMALVQSQYSRTVLYEGFSYCNSIEKVIHITNFSLLVTDLVDKRGAGPLSNLLANFLPKITVNTDTFLYVLDDA